MLLRHLKRGNKINADNEKAIAAAMADIDAEYEALVADYELARV